ncbi:MAG: SO2930 family diheme c-type cytochrome [Actinomycetota bacterium]
MTGSSAEFRRSLRSWGSLVALAAAIWLIANACGSDDAPEPEASTPVATQTASVAPPPDDNPDLLSDWGQLSARDGRLVLNDGVVPYSLNSALFSDHAHKLRTVQLPAGASPATYDPADVFSFPVGTVITKTFYYPVAEGSAPDGMRVLRADPTPADLADPLDLSSVRLIETRVLVHRADGWHALPYVWDDTQTEATLQRIGDLVPLTLVDDDADTSFTYVVPDANQCANCHATNHTTGEILPIGPAARHLNRDVDLGDGPTPQLVAWQDLGLLGDLPPAADIPRAAMWDDDAATIEDRARAYLDINCAHCHNRQGPADTSGLFLEATTAIGTEVGVCKAPIAAGSGTGGRLVGIAPGEPDESIFIYRMGSIDPAEMMPELGRSLVHDDGVALISGWIEGLVGDCG